MQKLDKNAIAFESKNWTRSLLGNSCATKIKHYKSVEKDRVSKKYQPTTKQVKKSDFNTGKETSDKKNAPQYMTENRIKSVIMTALVCMVALNTFGIERVRISEIYYHLDPTTNTAAVASAVPGSEATAVREAEVEKYNKAYVPGKVTLPEEVTYQGKRYSVTSIAAFAFAYSPVSEVVIPQSITEIGRRAFIWNGLQNVTITNPRVVIGDFAFSACRSLTDVNLPEGLTALGENVFNYAGIQSIRLPESITQIGAGLFSGCDNLEEVVFPGHITALPYNVCGSCKSLKRVSLPEGLTEIGSYAFTDCVSLTSINIPGTVTMIEVGAFSGCKSLPTLTVPAKARIEADAFYGAHGYKRAGESGKKTTAKPANNKKSTTQKRTSIYD